MRIILSQAAKFLYLEYEGRYVHVFLRGGLCNKLHCLFSACEILLEKKAFMVEPEFGWKRSIRFSDIYDMKYFNQVIEKIYGVKGFMKPLNELPRNRILSWQVINNHINLWNHSEKNLNKERTSSSINISSYKINIISALKLNANNEEIRKKYTLSKSDVALQVRTESDWKKHALVTKTNGNESVYVDRETIVAMISKRFSNSDIFFTTGEKHKDIASILHKAGFNTNFFYDEALEYEINAAINFDICCSASIFVGNSRSTFSNLVTLKRILLNRDDAYIYNLGNKLMKRVDKGLYTDAVFSVSKVVTIS